LGETFLINYELKITNQENMKQTNRMRLLGVGLLCLCGVPFVGEFVHIPEFFNGFFRGMGLVFIIAATVWKKPKTE